MIAWYAVLLSYEWHDYEPHVKYSLNTGGSTLCLCLYIRFAVCTFLCFEHLEGLVLYINHVCVSCSVSGTISLEIYIAALEHLLHIWIICTSIYFNPIKNLCSLKLKDLWRISPKYLAWCILFIIMLTNQIVFRYPGTVLSLAGGVNML